MSFEINTNMTASMASMNANQALKDTALSLKNYQPGKKLMEVMMTRLELLFQANYKTNFRTTKNLMEISRIPYLFFRLKKA